MGEGPAKALRREVNMCDLCDKEADRAQRLEALRAARAVDEHKLPGEVCKVVRVTMCPIELRILMLEEAIDAFLKGEG